MYPVASQMHLYEPSSNGNKLICANTRRHQFEIESLLRCSGSVSDNCVMASALINKNSTSNKFSFEQVLIDNHLAKKFNVACMRSDDDDLIVPHDQSIRNKFWIRNIRIADDIPGANVFLHFHDDRVELKANKSININEELLMWFSEEIASFMGIPFLIPGNIQGEFSYQ